MDLVYGAFHEFHPTHPRPFMAPALEAIRPRMGDILIDVWKKEAKL